MILVNLIQDKSNISNYISSTLLKKIEEYLILWKKIILYLNKRWEYSSMICNNCHYLYKCDNCDVSLNIHKNPEKMICHVCSLSKNIDNNCCKCNKNTLNKIWVWTQQIELILKNKFKKI